MWHRQITKTVNEMDEQQVQRELHDSSTVDLYITSVVSIDLQWDFGVIHGILVQLARRPPIDASGWLKPQIGSSHGVRI
jgi:hypothetical protein